MSQALARIDVGALVPSKPLTSAREVGFALTALREKDSAFILTPIAAIDHVPDFHAISFRWLWIDPSFSVTKTENGKSIYKAGPHCYFNPAFMSPGEVGLTKNGLAAILGVAGANPIVTRVDDRKAPFVAEFQAVVYNRDFDGLWRQYPGHKRVDLSPESPTAKAMTPRQLEQARQFIAEMAESKAILRALRPLFGLGQVYKVEDLKRKPWVVPKLVKRWDLSDPDQKRAAIEEAKDTSTHLFGGGPPADLAMLAPPVMPGEPAVVPPATTAPTTATPAATPAAAPAAAAPEPASDDPKTFDDVDFDEPSLVVCGCPCGCQAEISPEVAEVTKQKIGTARCAICYPGRRFDVARHKDLANLGIPRWPNLTAADVVSKWATQAK